MKFKLITAAAALFITQTAMAAAPTMPFVCPSVDTLKNIAISNLTGNNNPGDEYYGIELSNTYGTHVNWTFAIGGFEGKYRSEVLAKANAAISTLTLESGPTPTGRTPNGTEWECVYKSNNDSARYAVAVTPAMSFDTPELSKLLKK